MQVQCPHCGSVFESSSLSVHFCPSCGKRIDRGASGGPAAPQPGAPEAGGPPGSSSARPPGPPPPAAPVPGSTPWEHRGELGFFQAYFQTWKETMLGPDRFWQGVAPNGSLWNALSYAWITSALSNLITLPLVSLQRMGQREQLEQSFRQLEQVFEKLHVPPQLQDMFVRMATDNGFMVRYSLGMLIFFPLTFIITTAIFHLFCMMFGVSKNGFNATARVVGYSQAPLVLAGVPCIGFLASLYVLVQNVLGLARVQQTTHGRAAAAVLVPIGVFLCCICVGAVVAAFAIAGAMK